jgi:hypothetical protein
VHVWLRPLASSACSPRRRQLPSRLSTLLTTCRSAVVPLLASRASHRFEQWAKVVDTKMFGYQNPFWVLAAHGWLLTCACPPCSLLQDIIRDTPYHVRPPSLIAFTKASDLE